MILNTIPRFSCRQCIRKLSKLSAAKKPSVVPNENVMNDISNEVYKPRKHPGRMDSSVVTLPNTFVKAVLNTVEDYPLKPLIEASNKMFWHLRGKLAPKEKEELIETIDKVQDRVLTKCKYKDPDSAEAERRILQSVNNKIGKGLREKIYNWKPIKYDEYTALVYLMARAPAEYAVLMKIFGEIAKRDPEFTPRSLFDFGSGVGTVTWAANAYWKQHIFEYFNVDTSADMNDLAEILLKGGKGNGKTSVKGTFYRQFLPASHAEYDLVTSAYSFMELPSLENRLEVALNLWNKTHKYLVIVEQGTYAGFKIVNEIRDFILQADKEAKGHIFSPCPHDNICPRFASKDGKPCNFKVRYNCMPIGKKVEMKHELYSYVVLKKGDHSNDLNWPRVVKPILVRTKHSVCRICTANGKLREVIFTAKRHGKLTYHCARSSNWGDLLPMSIEDAETLDCTAEVSDNEADHDTSENK
ncbi:methyltransferase-like protein 17, mitochondrial [Dendroctonus ponderosae]